jgi:hypothetical protein
MKILYWHVEITILNSNSTHQQKVECQSTLRIFGYFVGTVYMYSGSEVGYLVCIIVVDK